MIITKEDFETVHGMSNNFWGWGMEDDEFSVNLQRYFVNISRPIGLNTGKLNTFKLIHSKNRARDLEKCFNQKMQSMTRDRDSGLESTKYGLKTVTELKINDAMMTILDVELKCNKKITPWCECKPTKY